MKVVVRLREVHGMKGQMATTHIEGFVYVVLGLGALAILVLAFVAATKFSPIHGLRLDGTGLPVRSLPRNLA